MVLDLGKDHYHLQGDALTALGDKVRHGNMEDVLKVYEEEMKVCRSLGFGEHVAKPSYAVTAQERSDGKPRPHTFDSGPENKGNLSCFLQVSVCLTRAFITDRSIALPIIA